MCVYEELITIILSLKIAFYATLIVIPLATLMTRVLTRSNVIIQVICETFINIPLILPPVATGFILLFFFGVDGIFGSFLLRCFNLQLSFSFNGVVLVACVVSFPIAMRAIRVSMENIHINLENVAYTLGFSKIRTFIGIILPLSWSGILNGAVLTFIRSLGEFGATIVFAGSIYGKSKTLSIALWSALQEPDKDYYVYRLIICCIFIGVILFVLSELLVIRFKKHIHL